MKKIAVWMSFFLLSKVAQADDLLVIEYRATREAAATKQWISTAGEAIYAMNYRLQRIGRQPLYCPPEEMRLMADNYISIVRLEVLRQGKSFAVDASSVADILIDGLVRAFPCVK